MLDYGELYRFLEFSANNVGDPWTGSNFRINTHHFEREVVAMCASLTGGDVEKLWGYVTSGGTEGNMYERGAVALSVDCYAEALAVLRQGGFQAVSQEALVGPGPG